MHRQFGSGYQTYIGFFVLSALGMLGACSGESENGTQGAGGTSSSSASSAASSSSGSGGSCAASEVCGDGLDNDCNGSADDGCVCVPGASQACYSGPPGTQDVGVCKAGSQSCNPDGLGYGPCSNEQIPQAETCDAALLDEDCDGQINEEGVDCVCGDGYISSVLEVCDDQNSQGGDGCSAACAVETGWSCTGAPSMCGTICGDGLMVGPETCDDGNTSDGDNCSSSCGLQLVEQVSLGLFYSCARLSGGVVKCWGNNALGQLGQGDLLQRGDKPNDMGANLPPINLGPGEEAKHIVAAIGHVCAILKSGALKCWGNNDSGQLGIGSFGNTTLPDLAVNLGAGKSAVEVGAGQVHTCALLNDGTVKCWGSDAYGALGNVEVGTQTSPQANPVDLGPGVTVAHLGVGRLHTCVIDNAGAVRCWGRNQYGELGIGNTGDQQLPTGPVDLGPGKTAVALAAGLAYTCALLNDGSITCWGRNNVGQLGVGNTFDQVSPGASVNLGAGKSAVALIGGDAHVCAVLNDSTLTCWGDNEFGQLGLNNTQTQLSPPGMSIALGTGKTAIQVAGGGRHMCAVLNDGTLKCWGSNVHGQLGQGNTKNLGDTIFEMGDNLPTVKLFSATW